jgi:hypothetical protein
VSERPSCGNKSNNSSNSNKSQSYRHRIGKKAEHNPAVIKKLREVRVSAEAALDIDL